MRKMICFVLVLAGLQVAAQEKELAIEKDFSGVKRTLVATSGGSISVTGGVGQ